MEYVSAADILKDAKAEKYAVAALDIFNLESTQAYIEAANEERAPIIIQLLPSQIEYVGNSYVKGLTKAVLEDAEVPVALGLDHGRDLRDVALAIKLGFSSVMFDGSYLPLEENIKRTREVVELAHPFNVSVEGELGRILGSEAVGLKETGERLIDPDEAKRFVEETNVDILSPAVGTVHGVTYRDKVKVEVPLIRKVSEVTSLPLALHGSFGTPWDKIVESIDAGICKLNLLLHVWEPFIKGVEDNTGDKEGWRIDPQDIMLKAKENMKGELIKIIKTIRSSGRAR